MRAANPEDPAWRPMRPRDVPAVISLSGIVHPGLFERPAVVLDRIALWPEGALVADAAGSAGRLSAYALAYPAPRAAPPPLDTVLGELSPEADALFIHDVAVDPAARGRGLAATAIRHLLGLAEARFPVATLVSVYGTAPYWERFGFRAAPGLPAPGKLASYGEGAVFMLRPSRGSGRDRPAPAS